MSLPPVSLSPTERTALDVPRGRRVAILVSALGFLASVASGCVQGQPKASPVPKPAPVTAPAAPDPTTAPLRSPASVGACGRLQALRAYRSDLLDLIAAIEARGVTPAERTDLMRAQARLHGAEADIATAAADVAIARSRLSALTGGTIAVDDLPACP